MCEVCGKMIGHDCRCPYYKPLKASHYCSSCGEGIYDGEEYVENLDGECIHYECIYRMSDRDLIDWLGYKIMTMEDSYEENY